MTPEKLRIEPQSPSKLGKFHVLFNPNSYIISRSLNWDPGGSSSRRRQESQRNVNAPPLGFGGGGSRTLSLDLFFDVTEAVDMVDVRQATDKIVSLTRIEPGLRGPPICTLHWGGRVTADFPFRGVVTQLTQTFTLFTSHGIPLRANLNVAFREFLDPKKDQIQAAPDRGTRVVVQGDKLEGIAAAAYGDPACWRMLAEANNLDDPLQLQVGIRLTIPERN